MERVIRFPVTVTKQEVYHPTLGQAYRKSVSQIPTRWDRLVVSMDVLEEDQFQYKQHVHHGIRTGKFSGITVLDIDYGSPMESLIKSYLGNDLPRTVSTPTSGKHYYFQYEPSLASIYNTRQGISVLNDGRFALFGFHYNAKPGPVTTMPKALVAMLLEFQQEADPIRQAAYELISILSSDWITEDICFRKLIHAVRSLDIPSTMVIATIRRFVVDRFGYIDEHKFKDILAMSPSTDVKRFTYAKLMKIVKTDYEEEFIQWNEKWNTKRPAKKVLAAIKPKLSYKHGAMTKLSDLKAIDPKLTAKTLLEMNPEYTVSFVKMCKYCSKHHGKGCCSSYSYEGRTNVRMVNNIHIC
jgi:hypothetical protein